MSLKLRAVLKLQTNLPLMIIEQRGWVTLNGELYILKFFVQAFGERPRRT